MSIPPTNNIKYLVPFLLQAENEIVRTVGDVSQRKKYSHFDLLIMIDGVDYERGANVSGNRGYFLKVPN